MSEDAKTHLNWPKVPIYLKRHFVELKKVLFKLKKFIVI